MEVDELSSRDDADHKDRNVDKTTSSMDMLALNNLVVSMRSLARRVRLQVIHKLTKKMKLLRNKKGPSEKTEVNLRKAERMLEELNALKVITIDHASKFALGNLQTFDEAAAKGDAEKRALTRMATHPLMEAKVKPWRESHSDWKALAAFILSKNTGRRFKAKPNFSEENLNIPKASTKLASLAQNPQSESSIGDRLLKISDQEAQLQQKDENTEKDAGEDTSEDEESDSETSISRQKSSLEHDSNSDSAAEAKDSDDEDSSHDDSDHDRLCADSESDEELSPEEIAARRSLLLGHSDADTNQISHNTIDASENVKLKKSDTEKNSLTLESLQTVKLKKVTRNKDESKSSSPKSPKKQVTVINQSENPEQLLVTKHPTIEKSVALDRHLKLKTGKEMVIKKVNLDNLDEDLKSAAAEGEDSDSSSEVPDILTPDEAVLGERKKFNPFFASGESDDEKEIREAERDYDRPSDDDEYVDDDAERQMSRQALESTFIGQLSGHGGSGRGRGRGFADRGRGQKRDWNKRPDRKFQNAPSFHGKSFMDGDRKFRGNGRGRGRGRGGFSDNAGMKSRSERRTERGLLWKQKQADLAAREYKPKWPARQTTDKTFASKKNDLKGDKGEKVPEKGLHPSWEASRKRKEQQTSILPFQGKKMKFDDD